MNSTAMICTKAGLILKPVVSVCSFCNRMDFLSLKGHSGTPEPAWRAVLFITRQENSNYPDFLKMKMTTFVIRLHPEEYQLMRCYILPKINHPFSQFSQCIIYVDGLLQDVVH